MQKIAKRTQTTEIRALIVHSRLAVASSGLFRFRVPLAVILLALLIRVPLALRPITRTADPWRETDTASIAHNFYSGGHFNIFYPQINWGGSGPGYVETEFQLYTFITAVLYRVFGEHPILGRIVSLGFSALAFFMFYVLAERLFDKRRALWALFFFVAAPIGLRYSTAFMPEATELFFYVTALYCFSRWMEKQQDSWMFLTAVTTALAILVKPTSIHIGLVFFLMLWKRDRLRFLLNPKMWLFGVITLLPAFLWFMHARDLYLNYGNTFGVLSGGDSKFGNLRNWLSLEFYRNVFSLDFRWVFSGVNLLLFVPGMLINLRERRSWLLILGTLVILPYYMLVGRYAQEIWGLQYHIYALPYAALGMGIGAVWLLDSVKAWLNKQRIQLNRVALTAGALLSAAILFAAPIEAYASLFVVENTILVDCAKQVTAFVPENALIIASSESVSIDRGVPNNYQDPEIFYYSHRQGWSLAADQHTPEMLDKFRQQGGRYFVIYSQSLYDQKPALAAYLQENTVQIGPGIEKGCAIYQLGGHDTDSDSDDHT